MSHLDADTIAAAEDDYAFDLATVAELDDEQRRYLAGQADVPDPLSDGLECGEHQRGRVKTAVARVRHAIRGLVSPLATRAGAVVAPMAEYQQLAGKSTTALTHDIVCAHTMVGTLSGSIAWSSGSGRSYWHFGLGGNGRLVQCQDLRFRSAANLNGNWHVIPIETADMGEGIFPSSWSNPLWTQAQIDKLVQLIAWLCIRYNIPPVLVPDTKPGRRGLAYHRQGIDPWRVSGGELWSSSTGKICPANRTEQFIHIVVPAVQAIVWNTAPPPPPPLVQEDDMPCIYECSADRTKPFLLSDGSGLSTIVNGTTALKMIDPNRKNPVPAYDFTTVEEYNSKVQAANLKDDLLALEMLATAMWEELRLLKSLSAEQVEELRKLVAAPEVPAGN